MRIEEAKPEDIESCLSVRMAAFPDGVYEDEKEYLNHALTAKNRRIIVAKEDGVVVGTAYLEFKSWNNTTYIPILAVDEKFRGKGAGSALIKELVKISESFGARRMFCNTEEAVDFYLKNGFENAGHILNHAKEGQKSLVLSYETHSKIIPA